MVEQIEKKRWKGAHQTKKMIVKDRGDIEDRNRSGTEGKGNKKTIC